MKKNNEKPFNIDENWQEKINNLYRFAEFGRISAGIFHDLINPLTIVSLNLEQLAKIELANNNQLKETRGHLEEALIATKKMENLLTYIKQYLGQANVKSLFNLEKEIKTTIKILNYQAIKNNVEIKFKNNLIGYEYFGYAVKFNQIVYNLLSNAIQACVQKKSKKTRKINILLDKKAEKLIIQVSDSGPGIKKDDFKKIFLPFYSTKNSCGLGLYITKHITEKDFLGTIELQSQINKKTVFSILIPEKIKKIA